MRSRISIAFLSAVMLLAGGLLGTAHAGGDPNCSGTLDRTTYTVDICLTAPAAGATISGDVPVSATVTVTGTNPGVDFVVFRLKGQGQGGLGVYALVDQTGTGPTDTRTYGFTLPSYRWPDAQRTIIARATMLDGYTTNPGANIGVTFSNPNRRSIWTPNTFTPRTPAPGAAHPDYLSVAAAGDAAIDNPQAKNASHEVATIDPDLFLYLGDVYNVGSMAEYYNWYGSPPGTNSTDGTPGGNPTDNPGALRCPGPEGCGNWGRFYTITNPAAGVHEYNAPPIPGQPTGTTESGYIDYWGMQTGTDGAGNVEPHYYSYDAGDCSQGSTGPCWHFVSLDSTDSFRCGSDGSACGSDANSAGWNAQYTWLQNDLATHTNDCTIAYWHHPYWGMKSNDEDGVTIAGGVDVRLTDMYQLMYQNGVDLLLTGHQHNFQRWEPLDAAGQVDQKQGITEIVDGAGGHPFGFFTRSDPRLVAGIDRDGQHVIQNGNDSGPDPTMTPSGIIDLNLYSDHADYSYRLAGDPGDPKDNTAFDSANIPCHGPPPDATPPGQPTNVKATSSNGSKVDLNWTAPAAGDIAGYSVYRATGVPPSCVEKCVLVGTTNGTGTTFSDTHVNPSTAYTYAVRARDTSGNVSPESDPTTVSTGQASLFSDDFEAGTCSGPVTGWTKVIRLSKTPTIDAHGGVCEADLSSTGQNIYASQTLPSSESSLWTQVRFRVDSQSTPLGVLKLRNTTGRFIYTAAVQTNGTLSGRDELTGKTTRSAYAVGAGSGWHVLTVHVTTGTSPHVDVFLDGNTTPLAGLSMNDAGLGSNPVQGVLVGDNQSGHTFSGALDDVNIDASPISP